jgi:2-polyprenyl-6-methoxyphenol hydroxylase-like FAD-dependent oxidoreductase
VGLFSALCLARKGIGVTIIDEQWRAAAHSYALALHPASLDLLAARDAAGGLLERGRRLDRLEVYADDEKRTEVSFGELESTHPYLLVLPQSEFEGGLERALGELGVKVLWNHCLSRVVVTPDGATATVDELTKSSTGYAAATTEWSIERSHTYEARFVVGADGHASTVRSQLGIPFESAGGSELFAVFEFDVGEEVRDTVRLVLAGGRASVLWPLPGGRCRWSFEVEESERSLDEHDKSRLAVQVGKWSFPHLGREDLVAFLRDRAPWFEGSPDALHWSLAVRFDRRLARSFGRDIAWLAGDAAHITGPVGIQSMNAGLAEASALADGIEAVLRRGASADTLAELGRSCRAGWSHQLATPTVDAAAEGWVRENAAKLVPCLPATGTHLDSLAVGLGLSLG